MQGTKVWNLFPCHIKVVESLEIFKRVMKIWDGKIIIYNFLLILVIKVVFVE